MATYTKNYSFKKPDVTDFYSVADANGNADMMDTALFEMEERIPAGIITGTYVGDGAKERVIPVSGDVDSVIVTCPGCPDTVTVSAFYSSYLLMNGGIASENMPLVINAVPTAEGASRGFGEYSLTALTVTDGGFKVGNDTIIDSFATDNYRYSCNGVTYKTSCLLSSQMNVTGKTYGYIAIMKK